RVSCPERLIGQGGRCAIGGMIGRIPVAQAGLEIDRWSSAAARLSKDAGGAAVRDDPALMVTANDHSPARLLDDPANFLHAIDVDGGRAYFLRTDAERLRQASFVDGRVPIATAAAEAPLAEVVADVEDPAAGTDRFLFNCSFCGS